MAVSKLYVGNLSYSVSGEQLKELFGKFGDVVEVNVIEGKGFAFVEFSDADSASKAQAELNGQDFEGRSMRVDEARPPKKKSFGGGGGGGRGGYGGGGGGGGRGGFRRY